MNYFICGFMGAGKTTLLKEIAKISAVNYKLIDLDDFIHQSFGSKFKKLGEFIDSIGMEHFRALEFSALMNLSSLDNQIIALGGGSLTDQNLAILSGWSGFWLDVDFETCWSRIHNDANRPLVRLGKSGVNSLFEERSVLYSRFPKVNTAQELIKELTESRQ